MPKPTLLMLLSLLINLAIAGTPAFAQSPDVESSASYQFGEQITFQAVVRSERPVEAAAIFFQAQNDTRTNLGEVEVNQLDASSYQLTYTHQIPYYPIRPLPQVEFR